MVGVVAFVLGFVGYQRYFRGAGESSSLIDTIYADIDLFKGSSRIESGEVPIALTIGRLLAPLVGGYTAFRGVAALYRDRFDRLRVQIARDHVVVVGGTEAAAAVARTLAHAGRRVILLDNGANAEQAASFRSVGVLTVFGDGTRPDALHLVRVHKASDVLALTDDDASNVDIALRARELATANGGGARVLASVGSAELCELLRIETVADRGTSTIDFFNPTELTARDVEHVLRSHGLDRDLLVMAPSAHAVQLVTRLARSGYSATVHLAGTDAGPAAEELISRFGDESEESSAVRWVVDQPDQLADAGNASHAGAAVVVGTGSAAMSTALRLARRLPDDAVVVAVLPDPKHLAALVDGSGSSRQVPIVLVDSLGWSVDADLVLGGSMEIIARATHDNYRATRLAAGFDANDPALVPWDKLAAPLKASNRSQAHHLWTKLEAIGCSLAPAGACQVPFRFEHDEAELLARMEHDRWTAERIAAGWRPGPRDTEAKTSPYLVPWAELSEEIRDLDRAAVFGMPTFVGDLGYRISRPRQLTAPNVAPRVSPARATESEQGKRSPEQDAPRIEDRP